jgi:hypothetical protein
MEQPRQPGARENRWAHLLGGVPAIEEGATAGPLTGEPPADVTVGEIAALKANMARLESEVEELKVVVAKLCTELGYKS